MYSAPLAQAKMDKIARSGIMLGNHDSENYPRRRSTVPTGRNPRVFLFFGASRGNVDDPALFCGLVDLDNKPSWLLRFRDP